jgi:solute carrier family 39 (zinc transporter), member 1/2/3
METIVKLEELDQSNDQAVIIAKIVAASCLFGVSVICGIIPFKLAKILKWTESSDGSDATKSSKVVSCLLCFGGGVLLATTFLHLLPEIRSEISILEEEGSISDLQIPIAEVLMMCGFFLIYFIEELVHAYLHRYQKKLKKDSEKIVTLKPEEETFAESFMKGISARNSVHGRFTDPHDSSNSHSRRGSLIDLAFSNAEKQVAVTSNSEKTNDATPANKSHTHHGHSHSAMPIPHSEDEDMLVSSLRGLMIVLALSIHELFEGTPVCLIYRIL